MTDSYANEFPLKTRPNPEDHEDEYVEIVAAQMAKERNAVAPNPLAQALYPVLRPYKPKRKP